MFNYILRLTSQGKYYSFLEYGGWIIKVDGCYTYDIIIEGSFSHIKGEDKQPKPLNVAGSFHSHNTRGFLPSHPSTDFSPRDKSKINRNYYGDQYMGTVIDDDKGGERRSVLRHLDPNKTKSTIIQNRDPVRCKCLK